MKPLRRSVKWIGLLVSAAVAISAWWLWPESPSLKVRRLLRDFDNLPKGKFELFYFGRSHPAIEAEWNKLGPESIPALAEAMKDPQCPMRYLCAGRLGEIGDARAIPALVETLQDYDFIVRMWAVNALGDIGDSRAVEGVIRCLDDEESCVRSAAAKVLGQLGDRRAVALNDALLEAGHPDLADPFRQQQWHPKCCWVLDLFLDKK